MRPGLHTGKIRIQSAGKPATVLELEVRVRPFQLQRPWAAFGMYFREDTLPARLATDKATLATYRDMAAHGQNSVTFYMGGDFNELPPLRSRMVDTSLSLAKKAGLTHPDVPSLVLQGNIATLSPEAGQRAAAWLAAECGKRGWPEIIEYGWDEPPYPSARLRRIYGPLRSVPIRLGTAMSTIAAYGHGDLHDVWIVLGGGVTSQMQAEADRLGAQMWTYSFRILREGFHPIRQRYYAGLYTWELRLGGNFVWAYCDGHHSHVWWAPDGDQPMPVTGWEARRDGVDDYRYLQMVEDCVASNTDNAVADEAAVWLQDLRARLATVDPHEVQVDKPLSLAEYDQIRARAAGYIEQLGPAAAPAVPELGDLLSDREVRIPALRALEAVGPDAYPTAKQVEVLCRDPDGYVRLGAVFTLGAMGSKPPEVPWLSDQNRQLLGPQPGPQAQAAVAGLHAALADESGPVAITAGQQLARFGSYATVALSDAIDMLDNPKEEYWRAGLKIIAAMGPAAQAAVPKIVERYVTLAAIGPSATQAVGALEQYATLANDYLADTRYALFCIRGQTSDIENMVSLLDRTDRVRPWEKRDVVSYLNALGIKAAAVADQARDLLQSEKLDDTNKEGLAAFLEKVDAGEGPYVIVP